MQREFRKAGLAAACLALAGSTLVANSLIENLPDRTEAGRRELTLRYEPVSIDTVRIGPFQVAGAWQLHVDDPRFGGISALAVDGAALVALSDSGVVARFGKPGNGLAAIAIDELPDGPGDPGFKFNRDSEAMIRDPHGRGWWVAFENRDRVWLYDRAFSRVLERRTIAGPGLGGNRGVEGMAADQRGLIFFAEKGARAVQSDGSELAVRGISGWISDAATIGDNQVLVSNRTPTPIGLSNRLSLLEIEDGSYRARSSWRVPVGRLDNVEALALERMPSGALRLWIMTDNNLQQRRPTLLIALELRPRPAR